MHVHARRRGLFDGLKKLQPLLVPVAGRTFGQNLPVEIIQGGKQGHRAMPVVIVGAGGDVTLAQRQTGLRAFQRWL